MKGLVAYTTTADAHHSLCSTQESKALALINYQYEDFIFNSKTKHLFARHAIMSHKAYNHSMQELGQGNKYATLYQSPIQRYSYDPTSNNTFATLFTGLLPTPRLLIVKTQGENLSLSLWDYEKNKISPRKQYLHNIPIPELDSKPIAENSSKMLLSPDNKKAVFLSKSGVLILFDIQTGKVMWKNYLTQHHTNKNITNYSFRKQVPTAIVIEQKEPRILLLFDWKTGKRQRFKIPKKYSSYSYKVDEPYILFERDKQLLLINSLTRQSKIVSIPTRFSLSNSHQVSNKLIFQIKNKDKYETVETILVLNMDTGNYQVLEPPFTNDKYYSSEYIPLAHGHHRMRTIELLNGNTKKKYTIKLHNADKHRNHTFQTADIFLYKQLDDSNKNSPELLTISYDKQKKQSTFCRLQLKHTH